MQVPKCGFGQEGNPFKWEIKSSKSPVSSRKFHMKRAARHGAKLKEEEEKDDEQDKTAANDTFAISNDFMQPQAQSAINSSMTELFNNIDRSGTEWTRIELNKSSFQEFDDKHLKANGITPRVKQVPRVQSKKRKLSPLLEGMQNLTVNDGHEQPQGQPWLFSW